MKLLIFSGFVLGLALAIGAVFLIGQSDEAVESQRAQPRGRLVQRHLPDKRPSDG